MFFIGEPVPTSPEHALVLMSRQQNRLADKCGCIDPNSATWNSRRRSNAVALT
jgi:hypothetical protein